MTIALLDPPHSSAPRRSCGVNRQSAALKRAPTSSSFFAKGDARRSESSESSRIQRERVEAPPRPRPVGATRDQKTSVDE